MIIKLDAELLRFVQFHAALAVAYIKLNDPKLIREDESSPIRGALYT